MKIFDTSSIAIKTLIQYDSLCNNSKYYAFQFHPTIYIDKDNITTLNYYLYIHYDKTSGIIHEFRPLHYQLCTISTNAHSKIDNINLVAVNSETNEDITLNLNHLFQGKFNIWGNI